MVVLRRLVAALAASSCLGHGVSAFLTPTEPDLDVFEFEADYVTDPFTDYPPTLKSRQDRVALRILPLGASIMEGDGSSHHSGYVISVASRQEQCSPDNSFMTNRLPAFKVSEARQDGPPVRRI
jgi:hypothetical protein